MRVYMFAGFMAFVAGTVAGAYAQEPAQSLDAMSYIKACQGVTNKLTNEDLGVRAQLVAAQDALAAAQEEIKKLKTPAPAAK